MTIPRLPLALVTIAISACVFATTHGNEGIHRDPYGAITRGDTSTKKLALVFTGDQHAESTAPTLDALKQRNIKASFFVTGNFLRQRAFQPLIQQILAAGHYLGPHSDSHPLYCDWNDRKKTLVTKAFFTADLQKNIADLRAAGALDPGKPIYFIPPYEWYNRDQVAWCREISSSLSGRGQRVIEQVRENNQRSQPSSELPASQVILINFTPGSGSNRDYAPEGDRRFVPSQKIYDDILAYEQKDPHGLNGFLLLLHLGSGRRDPFHSHLGQLCDELTKRGYQFERVDELLP